MTNKFYGNQVRSPLWIRAKVGIVNAFKGYATIAAITSAVYVILVIGYWGGIKARLADAQITDNSQVMFSAKIDALKNGVIDQLTKCESNGYKESDGLVTYDPKQSDNGKGSTDVSWKKLPSFGRLQFKVGTVQYYEKKRSNRVIDGKEAILIALDDVKSRELAKYVGFSVGFSDWQTCNSRLNLDGQASLIKNLER